MKPQRWLLLVLAMVWTGCSYTVLRTKPPIPTDWELVGESKGHSRGYYALQAVRGAEAAADAGIDDDHAAITHKEHASCSMRVLAVLLPLAWLFPLCEAEVTRGIYRTGGERASGFWVREAQCSKAGCARCPNWKTAADCRVGGHACTRAHGKRPICHPATQPVR